MDLHWLHLIRLTVSWTPSPLMLWMHSLIWWVRELIACCPFVVFIYIYEDWFPPLKIKTYIWATGVGCFRTGGGFQTVVGGKLLPAESLFSKQHLYCVYQCRKFIILVFRTILNISYVIPWSTLTLNCWNQLKDVKDILHFRFNKRGN